MRALVLTAPGRAEVREVDPPRPAAGQVVVDVERAGICGTDLEFFSGEMAYLASGDAEFPLRIGHEWCGTVAEVGSGVDPAWLGRRVTGDTMLGCRACDRCARGRQHLCERRSEIGIRHGWPGALAQRLPVPVTALLPLPIGLTPAAGALVEPGGNALRAVDAAELHAGESLLVLGAGTIGLLAVAFAAERGIRVRVVDPMPSARDLAIALGAESAVEPAELLRAGPLADAVIDATSDAGSPARTLASVEPGGRVVWIGLSSAPSTVDSRDLVLRDATAVGVLSGSGAFAAVIDLYASKRIVPDPLVAEVVGLDEVASRLAGERGPDAAAAPKVQVDPSR